MPDPRFFTRHGPYTLNEIAKAVAATLADPAQGDMRVEDVAPLDTAGAGHLSFLDNRKYRDAFTKTKAGACLVRPEFQDTAPSGLACLLTPDPYMAYARAAALFYPSEKPVPFISDRACIDPSAKIGSACRIEAGAVVGAKVEMGPGCWIEANAVIGKAVVLGASCRIGPGASVSHAVIGNDVRLYPGVRVGQDGFGFAPSPKGHVKVPQLGRVVIEDHVEIGANTCIDRGAGPDTVIGAGTWIDNLVQIAHNVKIGRGCMIAGQVGIAGSAVIEDFVAFGGQAGVAGHLRVGRGVQIAAGSGVITDIPLGETWMGYPALPKTRFLRHVAYLNKVTRKPEET